jgi:hypothetical protein
MAFIYLVSVNVGTGTSAAIFHWQHWIGVRTVIHYKTSGDMSNKAILFEIPVGTPLVMSSQKMASIDLAWSRKNLNRPGPTNVFREILSAKGYMKLKFLLEEWR